MTDLNSFQDAGCEPRPGPRAFLVLTRRALRRLLRPAFARLAEALQGLVARLDQAEARVDASQRRLESVERTGDILDRRTDGLAAHLSGLSQEFRALEKDVRHLEKSQPRLDSAETRLDSAEWNLSVLRPKTEGLDTHLSGLSGDHRKLQAEVQARVVQLTALSDVIAKMSRRQDELSEQIQSVHALHWDHAALARRLAAIEDHLISPPATH